MEYNKDIKEYHNITKTILNEESKLDELEKKLNKIKLNQRKTFLLINDEFVKHFNEFSSRVDAKVIENLKEFFGLIISPYNILSVKNKM